MNKKNYIKPIATVFACNTESLLAGSGSTGGTNNAGGVEQKPGYGGSTNNPGLFGSKDNSGMSGMSWDEEE